MSSKETHKRCNCRIVTVPIEDDEDSQRDSSWDMFDALEEFDLDDLDSEWMGRIGDDRDGLHAVVGIHKEGDDLVQYARATGYDGDLATVGRTYITSSSAGERSRSPGPGFDMVVVEATGTLWLSRIWRNVYSEERPGARATLSVRRRQERREHVAFHGVGLRGPAGMAREGCSLAGDRSCKPLRPDGQDDTQTCPGGQLSKQGSSATKADSLKLLELRILVFRRMNNRGCQPRAKVITAGGGRICDSCTSSEPSLACRFPCSGHEQQSYCIRLCCTPQNIHSSYPKWLDTSCSRSRAG